MTEIVPRWEWRTFGDDFGEADRTLASLEPERVQESDETYLLSRRSDASVKVRDGLMDVKRLQEVNEDGLEQWRPVMKAEYPLAKDGLLEVLEALAVEPPELVRDEYTLEQLVAEVIEPHPDLHAVGVHKQRDHYTIDGSMTELSEIATDEGSRRTIAVELEDPAVVIATVRSLGLGDRPNTCLAKGLKELVGFE
jgi:exopolyphosphatase / guanosine-5'-triphosphate,3'-diphosphate pyrophosphatase